MDALQLEQQLFELLAEDIGETEHACTSPKCESRAYTWARCPKCNHVDYFCWPHHDLAQEKAYRGHIRHNGPEGCGQWMPKPELGVL